MKILKVPRIRGCLCECSCWMLLAGSCEQIFQDSMMILSDFLRGPEMFSSTQFGPSCKHNMGS